MTDQDQHDPNVPREFCTCPKPAGGVNVTVNYDDGDTYVIDAVPDDDGTVWRWGGSIPDGFFGINAATGHCLMNAQGLRLLTVDRP